MKLFYRFLVVVLMGTLFWRSDGASVTAFTAAQAEPHPPAPVIVVTEESDGLLLAQPSQVMTGEDSVNSASAQASACAANTVVGLPTLLGPTNGAATGTLIPTFTWSHDVNDTRVAYYNIQIATATDFAVLLRDVWRPTTNMSNGATVVDTPFDNLAPATTYYWRVVNVCNINGNLFDGGTSAVRSFQTGSSGVLLPAPTQLSPPNRAAFNSTSVQVTYGTVANAVQYQVRFYQASSTWEGDWFRSSTWSGNWTTINGLTMGETIYWRVAARTDYGWGAASPERSFTITNNPATITIMKDALPNSATNFRFTGGLGSFYLDDISPQDGDDYGNSKTFVMVPGTYNITELVPSTWTLAGIACTPGSNTTVSLAQSRVTIRIVAGEHVTCTFTNHLKATFNTLVYHDLNEDRRYTSGEPGLPNWTVRIYDSNNLQLLSRTTDGAGAANFIQQLAPNRSYKICEDLALGWIQSVPATLNSVLGKPCYTRTPTPGQTLTLRFGNKPLPISAAAEGVIDEVAAGVEDVTVEKAPVIALDESGYDAGYVEEEETTAPPADEPVPAQTQLLFLPLISNAR